MFGVSEGCGCSSEVKRNGGGQRARGVALLSRKLRCLQGERAEPRRQGTAHATTTLLFQPRKSAGIQKKKILGKPVSNSRPRQAAAPGASLSVARAWRLRGGVGTCSILAVPMLFEIERGGRSVGRPLNRCLPILLRRRHGQAGLPPLAGPLPRLGRPHWHAQGVRGGGPNAKVHAACTMIACGCRQMAAS